MKEYKNIKVEYDNNIAVLTFNRPDVLNALNTETITETLEAVKAFKNNADVRVIIFTGAGRAFVAGADISELNDKTPEEARRYSKMGHALMHSIQAMGKPVIAAINGYALGGGTEIALGCDIRLASDKAKLGLPETMLGVIPGWGATQRTARLIGAAFAKELIFTGETITAQRALEIGLINRIVPHDNLIVAAMDMAGKICRNSPLAISHAKRVINAGLDKSLDEGCEMETAAFEACFKTEDQQEGMKAFIEKRPPNFKGK